jgi:ParB-like chromosome segregation protein Spo0J/DNA modification methylase
MLNSDIPWKYIPINQIDTSGRVTGDRCDPENEQVIELAQGIAEDGLLQPIVVSKQDDDLPWKLIAGGRRLTAFTLLATDKVPSSDASFYSQIPANCLDELPLFTRLKLEWEENNSREDVDWQTNVIHIEAIHKAGLKAARISGERWNQKVTGKIVGYSQAYVSSILDVAKALREGNEKVLASENFREAALVLVREKLASAQSILLDKVKARRAEVKQEPVSTLPRVPTLTPSAVSVVNFPSIKPVVDDDDTEVAPAFSNDDIANLYYEGDCLSLIPKIHSAHGISHFVCDPPYGIDMENLRSDTSGVDATHTVAGNLQLLPEFLDVAFHNIREDGFLCMFYDLDHHEKIGEWAKKIGWKVQRWPLVWCKTTPCQNSQAQFNFTKTTEVCYIMRRSEASVLRNKRSNNFFSSPACSSSSHPFVKPDSLWGHLIEAVSSENEILVDPFAGEGSMLAAAMKRNRLAFGCEIDTKHISSGIQYISKQLNRNSLIDSLFDAPKF